jgi:hypothetical protein
MRTAASTFGCPNQKEDAIPPERSLASANSLRLAFRPSSRLAFDLLLRIAGRILHLLPSVFRLVRDLPGRVGDLVLGAISPLLDLALARPTAWSTFRFARRLSITQSP